MSLVFTVTFLHSRTIKYQLNFLLEILVCNILSVLILIERSRNPNQFNSNRVISVLLLFYIVIGRICIKISKFFFFDFFPFVIFPCLIFTVCYGAEQICPSINKKNSSAMYRGIYYYKTITNSLSIGVLIKRKSWVVVKHKKVPHYSYNPPL